MKLDPLQNAEKVGVQFDNCRSDEGQQYEKFKELQDIYLYLPTKNICLGNITKEDLHVPAVSGPPPKGLGLARSCYGGTLV